MMCHGRVVLLAMKGRVVLCVTHCAAVSGGFERCEDIQADNL